LVVGQELQKFEIVQITIYSVSTYIYVVITLICTYVH